MKGKVETHIINTVVVPIIRIDLVIPMLKSLKDNTPPNYKTIVVAQTQPNRQFEEELYEHCDILIRTHVNYGYAKAANMGIRLSPTPYITVVNDDVLFLPTEPDWFTGCLETFERFPTAAATNPMSPKEPGWGWGEPGNRYLIPGKYLTGDLQTLQAEDRKRMGKVKEVKLQWEQLDTITAPTAKHEALRKQMDTVYAHFQETQVALEAEVLKLSHDPEFITALIEEKNWMVVDAFACWCTVFKADRLQEVGLFDERFLLGGAEDYDEMFRIYHAGYRALSTSHSWAFHFWGRTKESPDGFNTALPPARPPWNCLSTKGFGEEGLYDPDLDCWARSGTRTDPEIYHAPL